MTAPHYARLAATLLERTQGTEEPEPPDAGTREDAIAALEQAIAKKARARTNKNVGLAVAAAAVVMIGSGAALAAMSMHQDLAVADDVAFPVPAPVVHAEGDGAEGVAAEASPIANGQHLVAKPHGRLMLAFATGTELLLEERGDLTVNDAGRSQRFALGAGSMRAHVAKLGEGQRFVVATPDSEVEVRGTAFRVSVVGPDAVCEGGGRTRVEVTEGTVVVRHGGIEVKVGAGQSWPVTCAPKVAAAPVGSVAETQKLAPPAPSAAPPPSSQLAEMNDLFAEGIAAKRRGSSGQAVATFDRFLAKYPGSALAESAMAEKMKTVRTPQAAKQYLARYPNGFARAEAQSIVDGAP